MRATVTLSGNPIPLTGSALILNISSQGIAFATQLPIGLEESITLDLEWPVRLDGERPFHLKLSVRVIRRQDNGVIAGRINGYEMRTAASPKPLAPPGWFPLLVG